MRRVDRLKAEAREAATVYRGHRMKRFRRAIDTEYHIIWRSECKICGREVDVNTNPYPNQTDISGEAVALGCWRTRGLH